MHQAATRLEELKELAAQGDSMVMFCVVKIYYSGQGAVEWYKKVFFRMFNNEDEILAVECLSPEWQGVQKDDRKAVEWYKKAAEAGYSLAQTNLVACYWNGEGVQKHEQKAVELLKKATEAGYAVAQINLACLRQSTAFLSSFCTPWP
eukprot:g10018.t1